MGKRSDFPRLARDKYATPWKPVVALSPFLANLDGFCEPCAGDGALVRHLEALGHHCARALDLEPHGEARSYADTGDALGLVLDDLCGFTHFVTNPPWPAARGSDGEPTMSLIRHLSWLKPTWLLLSADFAHNDYAVEVLHYCTKIVSVGRVKWMPGTKHVGYDNAAWYLFDQTVAAGYHPEETIFYGRHRGGPVYADDIEELLTLFHGKTSRRLLI